MPMTEHPPALLAPGEWTPTGWGAQHRVRCSDEQWTEMVCHTIVDRPDRIEPGPNHRCETARINRAADENQKCSRCAALSDLGPLQRAPIGEVRRSPAGLIAVCTTESTSSARAAGRGWRLIGADPEPHSYGWRDDWDVTTWAVIGNVIEMGALL